MTQDQKYSFIFTNVYFAASRPLPVDDVITQFPWCNYDVTDFLVTSFIDVNKQERK